MIHLASLAFWRRAPALLGYPGERRDPLVETRGEENACKDRSCRIGVEFECDPSVGHVLIAACIG